MTDRHARIGADLTDRWPEHRIAPSLGRIQALVDLLGHPERSCPVIQITGTNGKGSTAIIIDALLRACGLRTGRFSSPHLVDITERICIDGGQVDADRFDDAWEEIAFYVAMVDGQRIDGVQMTFFEVITGMAYAIFADAPVDVMIMEVGLGGTWDATSVAEPVVSVICPIDFDHMSILGHSIEQIAGEKAGIIKTGSVAVIADQRPDAERVLVERCLQVGATIRQEGRDFMLLDRRPAVGGQVIRLEAGSGPVGELFLPLFGRHMANNAVLAVAAVEALLGRGLAPDVLAHGLDAVRAPARLEVVHTEPTIIVDTCHNPHGARATMEAVDEAFEVRPLIAVVAMMADKDVEAVLTILESRVDQVICTRVSSTSRAMVVDELAELAEDVFGSERVHRAETVPEAIALAVRLAEDAGPDAGVLVAGSVYLAGEVKALLASRVEDADLGDDWPGFN